MRSQQKKSWWVKYEESKQWHQWYAWRPVLATADEEKRSVIWIWREPVERRWSTGYGGDGCWVYRIIK